ncbi:MAG: hypothetical protein FGM24_10575 [Candidatus Kapabacteria bacterium]|nr:hypothetical protein [Candidatus Kapabacteria bacterium]
MGTLQLQRVVACFVIVCSCHAPSAWGQTETRADTTSGSTWIKFSGSAGISTELYSFENPNGTQAGRRPASLTRLTLAPVLSLGSWFSLPLNLVITLPETNVTTPALTAPSFSQFFSNPINQLGFTLTSEKLNGSRIHIGTHTPKFSELSGGDIQLFGVGLDARPGPVQIAASGGIAQRAVAPDSARGIRGAFRRDMYLARIGLGNTETRRLGVNVVYARDDRSSLASDIVQVIPARPFETDSTVIIPADTVRIRAEEGLIGSLDASVELSSGITLSGEMALSTFTSDTRADIIAASGAADFISKITDGLSNVIQRRATTRADLAGTAALIIKQPTWGVTFSALYMGAGFMPLGYPFAQADRIDLKVSPSLRLFEGDLALAGSVGQRVNNLSETKGEALTQFIANGSMNIRFSDALSLAVNYANFGIRSNSILDTLKIQNVSESFSIEPTLTIEGSSLLHTVTGSIAFDAYDDFNVVTGAESSNDTRSATLTYTAMFMGVPLTVGAMGTYVENALFAGMLVIRTAGLNASYRLFGGAVTASVSYTMAGSTFTSMPTDSQGFLKVSARWNISKNINLVASLANNSFDYGQLLPTRGSSFTEQIAQIAINSTF